MVTITSILNQSNSVPIRSPKTFHCRNLILFPIASAMFAHGLNLFFNPSLRTKLLPFQICHFIFLFVFPLISAALIFTVAAYCTCNPISAIPHSVFRRLVTTYLWVSVIMAIYNALYLGSIVILTFAKVAHMAPQLIPLLVLAFLVQIRLVSADDALLCRFAGVVLGLEPVYGFVAMEKCYTLLKARNPTAAWLVFTYLWVYGSSGSVFGSSVLHWGLDYGVIVRCMVGGFMVGWFAVVILVGLMARGVLSSSDFHH